MMEDGLDCLEVSGKTIKSLKLYESDGGGCEVLLDFTDGTSFSCCMESRSNWKASLFRSGGGTPEVLRDYQI